MEYFEKYCYLKEVVHNKPGISITTSKWKQSKVVMVFCAMCDTPDNHSVVISILPFLSSLPAVMFPVYFHFHSRIFILKKLQTLCLVLTKHCYSASSASAAGLTLPF